MTLQGYMGVLLFMFILNARSLEISENTFGNGIFNITAKDSSYSMKFAARFQSLYISQWEYPGFKVENQIFWYEGQD